MRKGWVTLALIGVVAGIFAFSAFGDFAQPVPFKGCFQHDGRSLVLGDGRVMVDGVDIGAFRYSRGDATKGPDNISVSASHDALKSIGLDPRRLWLVGTNGIHVPIEKGGYQTAPPCPA